MPIDIYSTRAQLAALELMPRDYSFLYDTFVLDMGAVEDDRAIYDFRKGVRQMAPGRWVARYSVTSRKLSSK